jgi:hypothetical protein
MCSGGPLELVVLVLEPVSTLELVPWTLLVLVVTLVVMLVLVVTLVVLPELELDPLVAFCDRCALQKK